MNRKINKILQELYEINPSLKENKDISKVVENMLYLKPDIKIDEHFKNELKNKLDKKISLLGKTEKSANPDLMQIFKYIFSGVFVTSIGIFSLLNLGFFDSVLNPNEKEIIKIPENRSTELYNTGENIEKEELKVEEPIVEPKIEDKKIQIKKSEPKIEDKIVDKKQVDDLKKEQEDEEIDNIVLEETNTTSYDYEFPDVAYDLLFSQDEGVSDVGSVGDTAISDNTMARDLGANYKMMQPSLMMESNENNIDIKKSEFIEKAKKLHIYDYDLTGISNTNTGILIINEDKDYGMTFSIDFDNLTIDIIKNKNKWQDLLGSNGKKLSKSEIIGIINAFKNKYNIEITVENMEIQENTEYLADVKIVGVNIIIDSQEKKVIGFYNY